MGKGAKQPTPAASLSPKSDDTMTEHRNSVLTTANQNIWTEMLKKNESFAKVAPGTYPQSVLNSRVPSRVASPAEFRMKILQDSYKSNNNVGVGLPTQAQLFPQRRRSSLPGSGGAYELVSGVGRKSNDGFQLRQPGRRISLRKEPLRGQCSFLESSSMSQKLQWMDLQMRVPEYLENLRGLSRQAHTRDALHADESHLPQLGQKRRSTLVLNEDAGEGTGQLPWFNRSSSANRGSHIRSSRSVSRSSITRPLVSKTATEERIVQGRAVEDRRTRQGSVMEVPVDPKHWLLQSLRLQDRELQELFDQMEDVPEMNALDISGVRDEWNELDKRTSEFPPDVSMLVKDQTLLDKVKNLLTRYIEVQDAVKSKERQEDDEEQAADDETRAKSPSIFEGFERNQEGDLLPVFSKGSTLCSLCGQMRPKKLTRDSVWSTSPSLEPIHALPSFIPLEDYVIYQSIVQPVGHEKEYKSVYSPQEKMFYTVLFPALQPGKRDDVMLLGEWLQHAVHNKKCHDSDGHVAYIDVSFLLHSIAFLETVRQSKKVVNQVSLECEERGDMLLHLWRQTLRIFNQVMASSEPKMGSIAAELVRLREVMDLSKEQFSDLSGELTSVTLKYKTVSDKLKQQEMQITRLQRCRLCLAENLTPRGREKFIRRATLKRFANNAEALQLQEDGKAAEELLQESLTSKLAPAPSAASVRGARGGEEGGKGAPSESRVEVGMGEVVRESAAAPPGRIVGDSGMAFAAPAPESIAAKGQDVADKGQEPETVAASPGEIIPGSSEFRIFKRISQGLIHDDGLHTDVPAQTDDPAKAHPFCDVLERPKTAPPRLNSYGMEVFEPLSAEKVADFKKQRRERRLKKDEETKKRGKMVENVVEGGVQESEESIRALAAETIMLLEQVGMNPKLTSRFRGILAKLRMLREGALSVEGGWLEGLDPETEAKLMELITSMGVEAEADKKKKKKDPWGKLRPGDSKRGSKLGDLTDDLLSRRGSGRGSEIRQLKPKDLPFVPLGFSKMMKINPPPKVIKNFNERQLLKLVEGIYASKIVADEVDDEVNNERQTSCEFVYDYMLNTYGLKGLAESAVHGVFKKIKKMMISKGIDKCYKLKLFQRFCGFDPVRGIAEPDLYMYLKVLARGQSKVGVLYSEQDDGIVFLNCAQADHLFDEPTLVQHFNGDRNAAADFINKFAGLHATPEKVTPELQKILKATHVKQLDFDLLMENVIDFNPSKEDTRTVRLKTVTKVQPLTEEEQKTLENLFVAGDANQDGVLTFTEFREIISSAEPSITQQNALRMFRETLVLMPDGGDSISPQAFATVAHAHGIEAPTDIIFNLLKKTWNQIQDDVNPDKMTQEEQRQEANGLREKLESLISSVTNASEAVSAFRGFVMKFCGGKGGAGEKLADAGHESDDSE